MINKYLCKYATKVGSNLITCKLCNEENCKYQQYCPNDHSWYNSELYKKCNLNKDQQ